MSIYVVDVESDGPIPNIYSGLTKNMKNASRWKKFKKTKHDHNPVNDAMGNAEALNHMLNNLGLK